MSETPTTTSPGVATLRRPAAVRLTWLLAGVGVLVVLCIASVAFGARIVSLDEVFAALTGNTDSVGSAAVIARIPRTVLAVLVGAALALSGATLQAVTRNPLADPGILGLSSGAALAVVIGLAFFGITNPIATVVVAIVGATGAGVFVYMIGSLGRGGATPLKLALAGAASAAAFTSLVSAILLPRVDVMSAFRFWQIGGVGGATWDRIGLVAPFLVIGAIVCFANARGMNSLALGDDLAAGLGEHVGRTRLVAALGAFVLCGAATAIAGPIGFVGLVVPRLCRLLVASDIVGRVIARPAEVEVGIVTALIGAPFFIWIVRRQKVREL